MDELRDCDIIIFTLSRWDAPISSPSFSLAKEFAKKNRVFYIDHPFSMKDFVKEYSTKDVRDRRQALLNGTHRFRKIEGLSDNLVFVTPPLTWPVNFLPSGPIYNFFSRLNDKKIFATIRQLIREYDIKNFIYLNAFDPYFCREFPEDIKPRKKIYQSMDDLTQVGYTAKHGIKLEEDIIRKFDVTLTTSKELTRLKSAYSKNVFYHPNAADTSIFKQAITEKFDFPVELEPARGKKIIGYTGNIESRIDYELLKKVIEAHHDKIIAMIGPVTTEEHKTIHLMDFPNVIMLGPRKITELPKYLQHFDCTLIPFKKNTLTKSIYPLKINEYLSAGKSVVATDFSEDIKEFGNVIFIGKSHEEFVRLIDTAIARKSEKDVKERTAVADQNTWTARVESFWHILENN